MMTPEHALQTITDAADLMTNLLNFIKPGDGPIHTLTVDTRRDLRFMRDELRKSLAAGVTVNGTKYQMVKFCDLKEGALFGYAGTMWKKTGPAMMQASTGGRQIRVFDTEREVEVDAITVGTPTRSDAEDAANYRWLREQSWQSPDLCVVARPKQAVKLGCDCPSHDRLDAAIAAARVAK